MDEQTPQTQDAPVDQPQAEPTQVAQATQDEPQQQEPVGDAPETSTDAPVAPATPVAEETIEEEDELQYPNYQLPTVPQIDFNNLQVGDDNLVDPTALAGSINQSIAAAEERATMRAQQAFEEQRIEEKQWDKAYGKYPALKDSKEMRDLVYQARLGEVSDILSKTQDPRSVKLPTPTQVADKLFKYVGNAKNEGFKQATENVVVQQSAHIESSSRRTNDSASSLSKARQNINSSDKEVARQARNDLLKGILFGEK